MPKRPVPISNVALGRCKRTGVRFFQLDRASVGVNPTKDRLPRTIRYKDPDTGKPTTRQTIRPAYVQLKPNRTGGQRKGRPWTGTTNPALVVDPDYLPPLPPIVRPILQDSSANKVAQSPERREAARKTALLLKADFDKCKNPKRSAKLRKEIDRLLDLAGIMRELPNGAMASPDAAVWDSVEIVEVGELGKKHVKIRPAASKVDVNTGAASGTGLGGKD